MTDNRDRLWYRFGRLAGINILSNLMVPLASLLDVAFLGHLAEIRHLAGVALATVLFNYIYWTFGFLRMGTTGTIAQATGRGDDRTIILVLVRNSAIALIISLIILILQFPLQQVGFALLSASPDVLDSGRAYYQALIWGAPATLLNFVLLGWFLGREQVKKVLLLSIIDKGANIVLDYLFIVLWGWESRGAGAATAISQYLNLFIGLILIYQEFEFNSFDVIAKKIFDKQSLIQAFSLNRDILIRTLALVSTFAIFTNLSSYMGTDVLATNTLLLQVVTLAAYFIDGIAFATESIAGSYWGKKNYQQLLPLIQLAGGTSLIAGLSFAALFNFFPEFLFQLLTNHLNIIERLNYYVWWLFPVLAFGSIAFMLDGYFLGLTKGKTLRNSSLIATLIGFAPVAIAAWQIQNSHLLWLSLSLFMATRAITLIWNIEH